MIESTSITLSKSIAGLCRMRLDSFNSNNSASLLAEFSEEFEIEENKFFRSYVNITIMGESKHMNEFMNVNNHFKTDELDHEYIDTKFYLKHVSAVIREFYWRPKRLIKTQEPTYQQAFDNISMRIRNSRNIMNRIEWIEPTIRDVRLVDRSLNWLDKRPLEDELLERINNVLDEKDHYFRIENAPTVSMLINLYIIHRSRLMEDIDFSDSMPVADIEEKIECECVVVYIKMLPKSTLFTMKDKSNNKIIWFSNGSADIEVGDQVNLIAKVLDHKTYAGICETRITNVRIANIN